MNLIKGNLYKVIIFLLFVSQLNFSFAQNNLPVANTDVDTVDQDTTLTVNAVDGLLSNDTDPDGDSLIITGFEVGGITYNAGDTAIIAEGSITINADGSFTFVPTSGYEGLVPNITYFVFDGTDTSPGFLLLTVETTDDLLEISSITSCNQGYTANGEYKIKYSIRLRNKSISRDYHPTSLITNIDLKNDLESVFGVGCINSVVEPIIAVTTSSPQDFVGSPYPRDWSFTSINSDFENITSTSIFNSGAITSNVLYPRQSISIVYCVTVNPFCNGRPNPTPSGSGLTFDNLVTVTSSRGNDSLLFDNLEDFHTTETTVAANLYIPTSDPIVNFDGTYDYTNTVIITNDGSATANNVNFIMGLGNFITNSIQFTNITVVQNQDFSIINGPVVNGNATYDGIINKEILPPNITLAAGESIILDVHYEVGVVSSESRNIFARLPISMTQGALDGHDETVSDRFSYVIWSDNLGNHLDTYYVAADATEIPSSNNQCECSKLSLRFLFQINLSLDKTILTNVPAANGIIENRDVTFQLVMTNLDTSTVRLTDINLIDDLSAFCVGNLVNVGLPIITNSTAETDPIINTLYDGITQTNIFDGSSGILNPGETITTQFTVEVSNTCNGFGNINTATFSGDNPSGTETNLIIIDDNTIDFVSFVVSDDVTVLVFVDHDNDGVLDNIDIDDDNDTIPDIIEYNGIDSSQDTDGDGLPDYLDTDAPGFIDNNADGLNDMFDFDLDGVLNHIDLDADNDGIFDIEESGNASVDTDNDGLTNNIVGVNGLDNVLENDDSVTATASITIVTNLSNSDNSSGNLDYKDIDADNDGIVDNIEAQTTTTYIAPNNIVDINGVDIAYITHTTPTDTDGDLIPDYQDLNSDDDERLDEVEGWDFDNDGLLTLLEIIAVNNDIDNDGLDDAYDVDDSQINPTNNQIPLDFPNIDISLTIERDWREVKAPIPTVEIDNPTVVEGEILQFTVNLSNLNYNDVVVDIFTSDATASQTEDYLSVTTTIIIPANTLNVVVDVVTINDKLPEDIETLTLNGFVTSLNTTNDDPTGEGTILDNDFPNLFSPNNDGLSDVFEIIALNSFLNFKIQIFDRWGSQVYNYSNNGNPDPVWWDGIYKGNPAPAGVYYYTLDYNDGLTKPKSGFVELIR